MISSSCKAVNTPARNVTRQEFLEADDCAASEYRFTIPVGIEVVWLVLQAHENFADSVLTGLLHHSDSKSGLPMNVNRPVGCGRQLRRYVTTLKIYPFQDFVLLKANALGLKNDFETLLVVFQKWFYLYQGMQ
ncbi:MAG: hypothetical protein ACI94O_001900 [Octadecabacter sp.]